MNLSVCLERQGQREKAINILNLIKQKPSFQSQQPKLFNNIGVMHHKNGNIAAAKDFIEKALLEDEKPQSRAAPASGAGVQESTLQSLSQEFAIHFNLAIVSMQKAALEEALSHLEQAAAILGRFEDDEHKIVGLAVKTHRLNISVNKALIYQAMKKPQQALPFATLALQLSPSNPKLVELKSQIEAELSQQSTTLKKNDLSAAPPKMRIIENHPNAESVSNQHSRKSSMAVKENPAGGGAAKESEAPVGTEELALGGARNSIPDTVA